MYFQLLVPAPGREGVRQVFVVAFQEFQVETHNELYPFLCLICILIDLI